MCAEVDRGLPEDIETYLRHLERSLNPSAIVLFGSRAGGQPGLRSDYDLLVIDEGLSTDFWERQEHLWKEKPASVDVIALTTEEIRHIIHRGLILDALLQGIVLRGDISELASLARAYIKKNDLTRTPVGYVHKRRTSVPSLSRVLKTR